MSTMVRTLVLVAASAVSVVPEKGEKEMYEKKEQQ